MKVGTDFSGIGAPETALKYLGIDFESVFACDIDKYAKESFLQLHKTQKFYNDITTRNHKEVKQLDLYIAGFPCQAFSMAGKRKGFDEARGTLFFNVAEFIKINQPKVFVLENVKGLLSHDSGKTFQTIIDVLSNNGGTQNGQISLDMFDDGLGYHIYWQVLNTKNYGIPQNRERIFIVGFKDFREFSFPKPIELKLRLGDMLQDNPKYFSIIKDVQDKYMLSEKAIERLKRHNNNTIDNDISNCIHAGYYKGGGRDQQYIQVEDKYYLSDKGIENLNKNQKFNKFNLSNTESKLAACITARCYKLSNDNNFINTHSIEVIQLNKSTESGGKEPFQQNRIYIRRLTPLECWRLQGFKDDDFFNVKNVSDTQLYKQAGNSITVDVLMHLFSKIFI